MDGFNRLEIEILNWIKEHYNDKLLNSQINSAKFVKREWTKVGYYVNFEIDKSLGKIDFKSSNINGPFIKTTEIQDGGGTIIWEKDGFIKCIEMFAYGNSFNEEISDFELTNEL